MSADKKYQGKKIITYFASMMIMLCITVFGFTVNAENTIESNIRNNCEPYMLVNGYYNDVYMGGNYYLDSIMFTMHANNGQTGKAFFNLGGNYESISFYAGYAGVDRKSRWLTVSCDGMVVEKALISPDNLPQLFSVSLSGVHQLVIQFDGSGYDGGGYNHYAIGGINLVSNGKIRDVVMTTKNLNLSSNNKTVYARAVVVPSDAKNKNIIWSSSNPKVATVDQKGLVTAVSGGTAVITAKTAVGGYKAACNVKVDMPIMPETVKKVTTSSNTNSIVLSWNLIQNATGYRIYKYNENTKKYEKIKTTSQTTYKVSKLKDNKTYQFKIKAYNSADNTTVWGDYSKVFECKTKPIVPAKVKSLKATQTTSSVKLSWSKVTGAQGYTVYRQSGKKWVKVADTKSTSYTVKKLKAGTNYKFAVKAYTKSGSTTYYSASYVNISTATKPGTPTLKATAGAKKATLSWNKQTGASGYVVYMATSKNGTYKKIATVKGGTKVSCTKTGLTKGRTYYFKVAAYKTVSGKNIYGAYSAVKSVKAK